MNRLSYDPQFKVAAAENGRTASNWTTLGSKPRGSEFVDWKSTSLRSFPLYRHPGENRGSSPAP